MDAVEYIRKQHEMCISYRKCVNCPLGKCSGNNDCEFWTLEHAEDAVRIVEEWAEGQKKTNARKFEEVFGFAPTLLIENEGWEGDFHPLLTSPAFWRREFIGDEP